MQEFKDGLSQYLVTDHDIVTFLIHPTTKSDEEDCPKEPLKIQKQSKLTAVQVVANALKQKQETEA